MNRREFFTRLFGAAVAARLAPSLVSDGVAEYVTNTTSAALPLTFKDIPILASEYAPADKMYFLSQMWVANPRQLGVITGISGGDE